MGRIKNKILVLLCGMTVFAAAILFMGFAQTVSAEEIAECKHEYMSEVVEPTCAAEGYTQYTCSLCGDTYRDNYTEKLAHTYSEVVIEPTCTHQGYTTHFCTVCGYEYTDSFVEPLGHNYTDTVTEPTCTEKGIITHTCDRCGYSFNDTYTAALGHQYETEVLDPTCTEGGHTTYTCTVCEYSYVLDYTDATGHAYEVNTVLPTCTMYGYTEHTCANCNDRYVTDYQKAFGHDYEIEVIEATEDQIGYTKHICKNCSYSYLSDFVTSGDGGYIDGGEEHEHFYIYNMVNDETGKYLIIDYLCDCGQAYRGDLKILFISSDGMETQMVMDEYGYIDYSQMKGTYRVTITNAEGEVLADFELVNGSDEHTHEFVFTVENNEEGKYLIIRYVCECGEKYSGEIHISYIDANGETGTLTANEDGILDYSMMEGVFQLTFENAEGEVLSEYELKIEPEEPDEPENPDDGNGDTNPPENPEGNGDADKTNNSATLITLLVLLGVLAAGGVTVLVIIQKKEEKR